MSQRHKLALVAALVGLALEGCSSSTNDVNVAGSNPDEPDGVNIDGDGQVHIGADASVDLAIFFKPTVSDEEIGGFIQTTLSRPVPGGGRLGDESDQLPGMQSTLADYDRQAVYVGFFDNAMPEERQAVKDAALASPLVDRIEEGIIPAQKYPRP